MTIRVAVALVAVLLFGMLLGAGGTIVFGPNTGPYEAPRSVILPANASLDQTIDSLMAKNILVSPATFRLMARGTGWGRHMKEGHYRIDPRTSNYRVLDKLRRGLQDPRRVTIPAGSRPSAVASVVGRRLKVDKEAFEAALQDTSIARDLDTTPRYLFGYMFPETYEFYWQASPKKVIRRIKASFDRFYDRQLAPGADSLGFTKEEVVILASIVEWETIEEDEKPTIAGVYLNRLDLGWPLQADPTIQYVLIQTTGERTRRVLHRDLEIDHPYNTYENGGLPPGPITNPSRSSLQSVVQSNDHNYLFFAADGTGGHTFSRSLREHQQAAAEYHRLLDKRKREAQRAEANGDTE